MICLAINSELTNLTISASLLFFKLASFATITNLESLVITQVLSEASLVYDCRIGVVAATNCSLVIVLSVIAGVPLYACATIAPLERVIEETSITLINIRFILFVFIFIFPYQVRGRLSCLFFNLLCFFSL